MRLDNEFVVPRPVDEAWAVLTDIERIAPCMPGAKLTGVEGEDYHGTVKIKVGPVTASYAGVARFRERDPARHRAVLEATGKQSGGPGRASAVVTADLAGEGDSTRVTVVTDLTVAGPLAQFGRGAIAQVSGKLLDQFVTRLRETVLADSPTAPDATSPAAAPPQAASTAASPQAASADASSQGTSASASPETASAGAPSHAASAGATSHAASAGASPHGASASPHAASADARSHAASGDAATTGASPHAAPGGASSQAAAGGASSVVAPGGTSRHATEGADDIPAAAEPAPVDLLRAAAAPVLIRLVPVVLGVAVLVILLIWLL